MEISLINIILIFLSVVTWGTLGIAFFLFFQYRKREKELRLLTNVIGFLFIVSSYNALYEGLYLLKGITIASSFNTLSIIITIPLCALYLHYRFTEQYPTKKAWALHLLPATLLLVYYIVMSITSPIPDRITYFKSDLIYRTTEWWVIFKISCFIISILQFVFYYIQLYKVSRKKRLKIKNPELRFEITIFLLWGILTMTAYYTPSAIAKIGYNLFLILIAFYIVNKPTYFKLFYHYGTQKKWLISLFNIRREIKKIRHEIIAFEKIDNIQLTHKENAQNKIEELLNNLMLETHLYRDPNLSIAQLAYMLSTNKSYLSRYFNQEMQVSFPQWILTYRLDEAEELLKDKNLTILTISEQVGFQSPSSFYDAFKSRHKLTPSQWRKIEKIEQ